MEINSRKTKMIEVRGLCVEFPSRDQTVIANDHIDLDLYKGQRLAVIGESGCGKSVLSLALMGLLPGSAKQKAESMNLKGRSMLSFKAREWTAVRGKVMSLIFQDATTMNPLMSIGKQIAESIEPQRRWNFKGLRKEVMKSLEEVQFPLERDPFEVYPHELSGGLAQRVMIAIALAQNPEILIADEPTTALDVTIQAEVMNLLSGLAKNRNLSLIFISHDLSLVYQFCDQIIILYEGMIVEYGETQAVLGNPFHPYTVGLLKALPQNNRPDQPVQAIGGEVRIVREFHKRCPFLNRCNKKLDACTESMPPWKEIRNHKHSLCWLEPNE